MDNEIKIVLEDEGSINIKVEDEEELKCCVNDLMSVIINEDHDKLNNLDYESSGHIGFAPSNLENLPSVPSEVDIDDIVILSNANNNLTKITLQEIADKLNQSGAITKDYNELENKPQIEGNELIGNKSYRQLGMVALDDLDIDAICD